MDVRIVDVFLETEYIFSMSFFVFVDVELREQMDGKIRGVRVVFGLVEMEMDHIIKNINNVMSIFFIWLVVYFFGFGFGFGFGFVSCQCQIDFSRNLDDFVVFP